jgi:hypothetical protein
LMGGPAGPMPAQSQRFQHVPRDREGFCDSVHRAGSAWTGVNLVMSAVVVAVASVIVSGFLSVPAVAHACVNGTVRRSGSGGDYFLCQDRGWLHSYRRSTRTVPTVMAQISRCHRRVRGFRTSTCARLMDLRPTGGPGAQHSHSFENAASWAMCLPSPPQ